MDATTILTKSITLLYRESQLENMTENSADLIKTAIEKIPVNDIDIGIGTRRNTTALLKDFVLELCKNPPNHTYELVELCQQIRLITNGEENLYQAIYQGIESELQSAVLKRTITNLRKTVGDFFRLERTGEVLKKASRDFNFNRNKISDTNAYIQNLITELSVISSKTTAKDPGLVKTMDFADNDSLRMVFNDVSESNSEGLSFKTGFVELDEALQGGPRPGDCVITAALQHNYKTGFSLAVFSHIPIFNKPRCKDPNKKPLCYRVTCEDPLRNNAQFMYQLLKYEETNEAVDIKGIDVEEMVAYVKKRLSVNGYHVLMDEVNPSNWTYMSIINRIIELESQGYCVEVFCIDYLSKIPTTGCVQGSMGDDMLDMLSKVRAYCSSQGILLITPHQLSTEAKRLLQTLPSDQFLHYIKGGGFFEKTKGLDRIYDIGVLLHKIEGPGGDFLHVLVDKHRFPSVVDSSKKSFYLAFPKNKMPIPCNYGIEGYKVLRKIPKFSGNKDDDSFDF